MTDPVADFRSAIAEAGITPPDCIEADGQRHRFPTNGKASDKSGWYVLHSDGLAAGAFGCWRAGVSETWRAESDRTLTREEQAAHRQRIAAMQKQREQAEAELRAEAAAKARRIWDAATLAPATHPYLERKQVGPHGLRVHSSGALIVPVSVGGEITSLQFIRQDGEKRFLTGGRIAGGYFLIGDPGAVICIAEGFATGATIREAAGHACAVAFSAGNLLAVAKTLRTKFPEVRLILCADHDSTDGNPGLTAATEAARAVGADLAVPPASGDYNDMHLTDGLAAVAAAIQSATESSGEPAKPARLKPTIDEKAPLDAARHFVALNHRHRTGRTLCYWQGDFYAWSGTHYARLGTDAIRAELYAWLDTGCRPRKRLVDEICDALKAECHLDARPPEWLGSPVCAGVPVALGNGLLHVPTRTLHAPTASYFNLTATPFDYDPAAAEPAAWLGFLASLWPEDLESRDALQELFGMLLTSDASHQKIILLIGPKRGGKGTIAHVLSALVGAANICAPTLAGLGQNFGLSSLVGKSLAIISDARLSGRSDLAAVTENLLRISGEDNVSVPRKFQADWVGRLPTRFLVLTNELPAMLDSSGALASRFLLLRLTETFYGREDRTLQARLLAELPAIFNWSLAGLDRLTARGHLIQPASGAALVDQLDRLGSPIKSFVADECTVDDAAEIPCADLFDAWVRWCEAQHRDHPSTLQMFGRNLVAAYPSIVTRRPRVGGDRQRVYAGIRLRRSEETGPGPRWSADLSIAHSARESHIYSDHNRPDRGPSRTTGPATPDNLLAAAELAAGMKPGTLRPFLSWDDLSDPATCNLQWLTTYARSLATEVRS